MQHTSFEGLECWKKARILRKHISDITILFPESEKYSLTLQILRSSRSITANIAEGWGKVNFKDNIRFCRIARGSLFETLDHLITAIDEEYISNDKYEELRTTILDCIKVLNG